MDEEKRRKGRGNVTQRVRKKKERKRNRQKKMKKVTKEIVRVCPAGNDLAKFQKLLPL